MKKYLLILPLLFAVFVFLSFSFFKSLKSSANVPTGCCPIDEGSILQEGISNENSGEYLGKAVNVPLISESLAYVLGDQAGAKRIEVNLASQHVYGFDGSSKVFDFTVSTGKWYATPKGTFTIQRKVRAQKMSGGNRANGTYYYLPNVPYVMFFGNSKIPWYRGFSFHGTYWHNNFGTPMSHGCVNMKTPEAEQLFSWAPIGTPVVIY